MIRFPFLENHGLTLAAFSECRDGDFSQENTAIDFVRKILCDVGIDTRALRLFMPNQVHGIRVVALDDSAAHVHRSLLNKCGEADGMLTNVPGIVLGILTADCVPIFLYDKCRAVVGLIHAGRKGTFGGIIRQAIELMRKRFDSSPKDVKAVLGPSACPNCYEVSDEILLEWSTLGFPHHNRRLNLWEANVAQLRIWGVPKENIYVSSICTIEDTRFYSFRRNRSNARNLALVIL